MRTQTILGLSTALLTFTLAPLAHAGEPGAEAEGGISLSSEDGVETSGSADAEGPKAKEDKWIHRWAPEPMMGEIGIYGGVFLPANNLELFKADPNLMDQGFKPFKPVAPDIGIRAGFYPIKWVGAELEGGVMPMRLDDGSDASAIGWTVRGHAVAQLAKWSVTPFALAGIGALGVASDANAVGNDVDFALHFGLGAKVFINQNFGVRLDVRDVLGFRRGVDSQLGSNNFEILLGLYYTFGRKPRAKAEEPDTDGDGILDKDDQCVNEPGPAPTGCPIPEGGPVDSDGDGIYDHEDKCPDEPGVAEYDGCPIPDTDGDGILDPDDKCVDEPETQNDYEDTDGCPDEVPEEVKAFTGVIEGIYFDTNKDTIKPTSEKILKKALKVLEDFPSVRLKIDGHTDSRGDAAHNQDLSERRAKSVKKWFEDHGIDGNRFETQGFGPDQPIETNDTKDGRAKNRRIEFKLIK